MLPPFVPPAARVSSETLPLITEFVVDRIEHSFESSFNLSGGSGAVATATLPSIDEFVLHEPESAQRADDEFMQRTSRSPWGTYEAEHEVDHGTLGDVPRQPSVSAKPGQSGNPWPGKRGRTGLGRTSRECCASRVR